MRRPATCAQSDLWRLFDLSCADADGSLEGYLSQMLDGCVRLFHASGASVFVRQDAADTYSLAAQGGIDSRIPLDAEIVRGRGIAGSCVATGQPLLVVDPKSHPLLKGKVSRRRGDVGSALVLPLMPTPDECVGVLNLTRGPTEHPFADGDVAMGASLARHIALAVKNARLIADKEIAVQEVGQTRDKLRSLIACLAVGVVAVDQDKRISDWNPEAESLLDEYALGDVFSPAASGQTRPLLRTIERALEQALEGKRAQTRALDSDEDLSWSIVSAPLEGGGAAAVIQDFTPHVRAAREMARLKRLAEIGQMTAAIAHEIRNPLTGITGAAQMIRDGSGDANEFATMIEEEARKLNELCTEFLDFARPLSIKKEPVALRRALESVLRHHAHAAERAGVSLEVRTLADEETLIVGDPVRVEQVAHNLVLNAIQACHPGDAITIEVGRDGFVVRDTGHGMDQETAEKLFTPFFTTKAHGTGLGMINVRKIVDAHGGHISVKSEKGRGTTVEVEFDVRRSA